MTIKQTLVSGGLYIWDKSLGISRPYGLPLDTPFMIVEMNPDPYRSKWFVFNLMTVTGKQTKITEHYNWFTSLILPLT
jgi:hypothetical protein